MILHEEPASIGQRMLFLLHRHRGAGGRLNYPLVLRLRGQLDMAQLQRALDQLVARHESLRTTFARRDGRLTQLVHAPGPVPLTTVTLDGALDEALRQEAVTSIDPVRCALRVTLWMVAEQDHVLCLNAHHLVTDAWSSRLLTDELCHLLSDPAPLRPVAWQYRHFTRWQQRRTTVEQWRGDEEYWRAQLSGARPPGLRPPDRAVDAGAGPAGGTVSLDLDGDVAGRLDRLARTQHTTDFGVLLAMFHVALRGETGQTDLCVAAPFANRTRPESSGTVGLLANLVLLRTRADPGGDFRQLLARTRDTLTAATAHQGFPYYLLPTDQAPADRPDRLGEVVFQMLPEVPAARRVGPLEVDVLVPQLDSRFDLELAAVPHPAGLRIRLQYARERVSDATAAGIAEQYRRAVRSLL